MENESKVGLTTQERSSKVFSKYACEGYPVSFIVVLDRSGQDIILSLDIIRLRKKSIVIWYCLCQVRFERVSQFSNYSQLCY